MLSLLRCMEELEWRAREVANGSRILGRSRIVIGYDPAAKLLWSHTMRAWRRCKKLKMLWIRGKKRKGGFTLIEIMIVVLIIAILLAIAIPNFMRARETSRAKSCQGNLRQIETAKEQWAMDTKAASTAAPSESDLVDEYMKGTKDKLPDCPSNGTYSIGTLQVRPSCSIGTNGDAADYNDHVLK